MMIWATKFLPPTDCGVDETTDPMRYYLPIGYDEDVVDDFLHVMECVRRPSRNSLSRIF